MHGSQLGEWKTETQEPGDIWRQSDSRLTDGVGGNGAQFGPAAAHHHTEAHPRVHGRPPATGGRRRGSGGGGGGRRR